MKKGELSRAEAVELVGEETVNLVESLNCEPTGRVNYNGECQNDDLTEWSASVKCIDNNGCNAVLTAYYYTDNDEDKLIAETGDGASIDWEITGYEIS